ncbi:hypothetical protein COOONC_21721 [Cooperia oncophora]
MLHSLAFHHLCSVSPEDAKMSAWLALHSLEASAAITHSEVSEREITALQKRDDLAEYCVDSLIPAEGGIQRLHAEVYREGIGNCSVIWPIITLKHMEHLFNRLVPFLHRSEVLRTLVWMIGHDSTFEAMTLIDDVISKSPIGKNKNFEHCSLTSIDVKVFRWLEVSGENDCEKMMMLYATTISDTITGAHPFRKRCDELFPDGIHDEEEMTVDEVDDIEEHVSRYLAKDFLMKGQFGEAERRLVYAKSLASKQLLIKVYQSWIKHGHLDEQEHDELSRRLRELECECRKMDLHENTPTTSSPVSSDSGSEEGDQCIIPVLPVNRKLQVDSSTNTPSRGYTSSPPCDPDESFFSVKSDHTNVATSDRSFASAIASPSEQKNTPKAGEETKSIASDGKKVQESKSTGSLTSGTPRGETHAVLSMTDSHSISVIIPDDHRGEKSEEVTVPGRSISGSPKPPGQGMSPSVITSTPVTSARATVSPAITTSTSSLPPIVTNSPFGKFIASKEAATSFWKSGKPVAPVFGAVPPCISAQKSDQKSPASGATIPAGLSPRSVPKTTIQPPSIPVPFGTPGTVQAPFSSTGPPKNVGWTSGFVPPSVTPIPSIRPPHSSHVSPHHDISAMEEFPHDDENFYDNFLIELCNKKLERAKHSSINTDDIGALQEKMAQIQCSAEEREYMELHFNSLHRNGRQSDALAELEQRVAQILFPPAQPAKTGSFPTTSHAPLTATEGIAIGGSFVARHPGSSGVCFGCLDDETQDRALKTLDRLAHEWNTAADSDSD